MRNRFMAVMLTLAILAAQLNIICVAEETQSSRSMDILTGLGFLDTSVMFEGEYITRAEAASVFAKMLKNSGGGASTEFADVMSEYWASEAINTVHTAGIMTGSGGKFRPADALSGTELTVILVRMLGYSPIAVQNGGYPDGYITAAVKARISTSTAEKVTYEEFADIVADALRAMVMTSKNNALGGYEFTGETYLEHIGIEYGQGRMRATENMCFYGDSEALKNCVVIDSEEYLTDGTDYDELMGMTVEFYYDINDDNRIIYIRPKDGQNDIIEINIEDISKVADNSISYYQGSRMRSVSIKSTADIMVNGRAEKIMIKDFSDYDCGNVRLMSSSGSGYDFVSITAYKTAVVQNFTEDSEILYLKNGEAPISFSNVEPIIIKDTNGNIVQKDELKEGTVVSVAASADGKRISILCSDTVITGALKSRSDNGVTINDTEYKYSKSIKNDLDETEIGKNYEFSLDAFGRVSYISRGSNIEVKFGYMLKLWCDDSGDTAYIKMFETNGTFTTRQLAEKVRVDGDMYDSRQLDSIRNGVKKDGLIDQLVVYKLDGNGCVNYIDTSFKSDNENDSTLKRSFNNYVNRVGTSATRLKYSSATKIFSGKVVIDSNTKVLFIPKDAGTAPENFFEAKTVSRYQQDRQYSIDCYTVNPDSFITDIIIEYVGTDYALDTTSPGLFLVDKISTVVNDDNEAVAQLSGYGMKGAAITLPTSSMVDLNKVKFSGSDEYGNVEPGDVVRYKTNPRGEIIYLELYFDESRRELLTQKNPSTGTATGIAYSDQHRFIWGNVYEKLDNIAMVVRDDLPLPNNDINNAEWWEYQVLDKSVIFKFEKDIRRSGFRVIPKEEIKDYVHYGEADKILAYTYWGDANTIIIY